jgi:dihydrofolate reductase
MISLVLARADNGAIGLAGGLPWRIAEDMRRFKALTLGKPCIMGRKTWEGLPEKFRPLPGRSNIVVTRTPGFAAPGTTVVHTLDEANVVAGNAAEVMVIGGAQVYAAALPQAQRVYLTEIHAAPAGDAFFPAFAPEMWREAAREDIAPPDGVAFSFVTLERREARR